MFLYVITNCVNGKQYVGITKNPKQRWHNHGSDSKCPAISNAIRKYGKENFTFDLIFEGDEETVKFLEQQFIVRLETKSPLGYNLTDGGDGCTNPSEASRRKRGDALRGRPLRLDTREKLRATMLGRKLSTEHRKKISESGKGRHVSLVSRNRIRDAKIGNKNPNFGKTPSIETRRKMSISLIGRRHSLETRKKIQEAQQGANSRLAKKSLVDGKLYPC